jgi:hypothetical protein
VQERLLINKGTEAGKLARDGAPNLGLGVFEEFYKRWHEISADDFVVDCFRDLLEAVCDHVSHSPTLILE